MMIIRKLKRIICNRNIIKRHIIIGNSVLLHGFNLELRNPEENKKYLEIGDKCIIDGRFVFESIEGTIKIGNSTYIGSSTFISRTNIIIGNNVTIAWGCTIYDHDSHSVDYKERRNDIRQQLADLRNNQNFIKNKNWSVVNTKPIIIEDDVWIGMNVIVLKGVKIGRGAIVGAGSIVSKDVESWTVVAGNPASKIKEISLNLRY